MKLYQSEHDCLNIVKTTWQNVVSLLSHLSTLFEKCLNMGIERIVSLALDFSKKGSQLW